MVFGSPNGFGSPLGWSSTSMTRASSWRRNDWSSLFSAQRDLFLKENQTAAAMQEMGMARRAEIFKLLEKASQLWEAACWFQSKAREASAAGNPIVAQTEMVEARRLAADYNRHIQECQRLLTEAQAMALDQREHAQAERQRLRQEFAIRYMHFG